MISHTIWMDKIPFVTVPCSFYHWLRNTGNFRRFHCFLIETSGHWLTMLPYENRRHLSKGSILSIVKSHLPFWPSSTSIEQTRSFITKNVAIHVIILENVNISTELRQCSNTIDHMNSDEYRVCLHESSLVPRKAIATTEHQCWFSYIGSYRQAHSVQIFILL